jgi:cold-inducible RNA-binding protein
MSTKLFVGNLSFNTTENDLQDAFAAHGPVDRVDLMMDKMSGRSRGFAFVTMGSPEAAKAAIEAMNGTQLDGRALTVNEARPREERPARPGGGGGYGGGGGGGDRGPRRDFKKRYEGVDPFCGRGVWETSLRAFVLHRCDCRQPGTDKLSTLGVSERTPWKIISNLKAAS